MPPKSKNANAKSSTTKSTKTKSSSSNTQPVSTAPVETAPVETAPVETAPVETAPVETASVEVPQATIESQFNDLTQKLAALRVLESDIMGDLRKLQKNTLKHLKDLTKKNKRRKLDPEEKKKRAPSGFAKPTIISQELCDFLGKDQGTEMARTEVTKELTKYIKSNNLQDEADRRKILPDKKLKKLLNVEPGQEVTYFNLQKYMKVHFPKPTVVVSV
jgi:chromatin remodeling complex protein RSC6